MSLTNLMTVLKTVAMAGVKLTVPADRTGLGFGTARAYPADNSLSPGRFPAPHNPESEQLRSRQERSATRTPPQSRPDGTPVPDAVPPASSAGCLTPGCSADRSLWQTSVPATDTSRNRDPKVCVRSRIGSDCQSLARLDEKQALTREAAPDSAAGK